MTAADQLTAFFLLFVPGWLLLARGMQYCSMKYFSKEKRRHHLNLHQYQDACLMIGFFFSLALVPLVLFAALKIVWVGFLLTIILLAGVFKYSYHVKSWRKPSLVAIFLTVLSVVYIIIWAIVTSALFGF